MKKIQKGGKSFVRNPAFVELYQTKEVIYF